MTLLSTGFYVYFRIQFLYPQNLSSHKAVRRKTWSTRDYCQFYNDVCCLYRYVCYVPCLLDIVPRKGYITDSLPVDVLISAGRRSEGVAEVGLVG